MCCSVPLQFKPVINVIPPSSPFHPLFTAREPVYKKYENSERWAMQTIR